MSLKRFCLPLAALLAAAWSWAAAVVICDKCGHEAAQQAVACAHCGAALPKVAPVVAPLEATAASLPAESNLTAQALAAVREDVRLARESTLPEVSLAFYGNALAVLRLVPLEAVPAEAGNRLVEGMAASRAALARTARPCPTCGGSGSRSVKLQSLAGGADSSAAAGGLVCATCEGAGLVRSGRSADELRVALAQGRRKFEVREQAAGRVAVGRAWVPSAVASHLDLPRQVLLRSATAAPCTSCQGIGLQTCVTCRGLGRVKCREKGCDGGWVVLKPANTLAPKTALRPRTPCPACQGTSWSACTVCRSSGAVVCAACQGIGQPPRCGRCGGEGTVSCARCRGSGQVGGAACAACSGVKQALCPACYGEGRLSR